MPKDKGQGVEKDLSQNAASAAAGTSDMLKGLSSKLNVSGQALFDAVWPLLGIRKNLNMVLKKLRQAKDRQASDVGAVLNHRLPNGKTFVMSCLDLIFKANLGDQVIELLNFVLNPENGANLFVPDREDRHAMMYLYSSHTRNSRTDKSKREFPPEEMCISDENFLALYELMRKNFFHQVTPLVAFEIMEGYVASIDESSGRFYFKASDGRPEVDVEFDHQGSVLIPALLGAEASIAEGKGAEAEIKKIVDRKPFCLSFTRVSHAETATQYMLRVKIEPLYAPRFNELFAKNSIAISSSANGITTVTLGDDQTDSVLTALNDFITAMPKIKKRRKRAEKAKEKKDAAAPEKAAAAADANKVEARGVSQLFETLLQQAKEEVAVKGGPSGKADSLAAESPRSFGRR